VFYGLWSEGQRTSGTHIYADGSIYIGSFKNDLRNGYGQIILLDGTKKEGIWKDNEL